MWIWWSVRICIALFIGTFLSRTKNMKNNVQSLRLIFQWQCYISPLHCNAVVRSTAYGTSHSRIALLCSWHCNMSLYLDLQPSLTAILWISQKKIYNLSCSTYLLQTGWETFIWLSINAVLHVCCQLKSTCSLKHQSIVVVSQCYSDM